MARFTCVVSIISMLISMLLLWSTHLSKSPPVKNYSCGTIISNLGRTKLRFTKPAIACGPPAIDRYFTYAVPM